MKKAKAFAVLVMLGGIGVGGWWVASRKNVIASPASLLAATPIPMQKTLKVEHGQSESYTFAVPADKLPGRLQGHWTCKGSSAGIKGAKDDTLVGAQLRGPDNKVIQDYDHPTAGNFSFRITAPGIYTFTFDNSCLVRSTPRIVEIEGSYQPD